MPKINVYVPDDLAEAVRKTGVPVSAVCQRALEQAVERMTAIRTAVLSDVDADTLAAKLPNFTRRAVTALSLAAGGAAGGPNVTTVHLLRGMIAEGGNLAVRILILMEIDLAALAATPIKPEPGGGGDGLRFSTDAGNALNLAVSEATAMGHNYVGCEHLLIGLCAEQDGNAGRVLRNAGAQPKSVRHAVTAALAGYTHLRATAAPAGAPANLLAAVRAEIQPLIQRIERLENPDRS
jgi:ATP-dependent Clp protease ATP-binding subunit ClpA